MSTALVVAFAQPAVCPLCGGHRFLDVQPLDGRAPALMPCPLCSEPGPFQRFLETKGNPA